VNVPVFVGVFVGVWVGVFVGVLVLVAVGVFVGVLVGVEVGVADGSILLITTLLHPGFKLCILRVVASSLVKILTPFAKDVALIFTASPPLSKVASVV
jgi:hypothetical protein